MNIAVILAVLLAVGSYAVQLQVGNRFPLGLEVGSTEACNSSNLGTLRFENDTLEVCTTSGWHAASSLSSTETVALLQHLLTNQQEMKETLTAIASQVGGGSSSGSSSVQNDLYCSGHGIFTPSETIMGSGTCDCYDNEILGFYTGISCQHCAAGVERDSNGLCVTDIDECSSGSHNCPSHSACVNTIASFECPCDTGYTASGGLCVDVNECSQETDSCSDHAVCTNTDGSYTCDCQPDYYGDGFSCETIEEYPDYYWGLEGLDGSQLLGEVEGVNVSSTPGVLEYGSLSVSQGIRGNSLCWDIGTPARVNLGDFAGSCISDLGQCSQGITVMLWYYPLTSNSGRYVITSGAQSNGHGFAFSYLDGNPFVHMIDGSQTFRYDNLGSGVYTVQDWNHLTIQYDPSGPTTRIFFNGVDGGITPSIASFSGSDVFTTLTLGGPNSASVEHFHGCIDEVMIFNRVLPAPEINQLYLDLSSYGTFAQPGQSCLDILQQNPVTDNHDGYYWIIPSGFSGNSGQPWRAWCDMSSDGKGWTLLGTHVKNSGSADWCGGAKDGVDRFGRYSPIPAPDSNSGTTTRFPFNAWNAIRNTNPGGVYRSTSSYAVGNARHLGGYWSGSCTIVDWDTGSPDSACKVDYGNRFLQYARRSTNGGSNSHGVIQGYTGTKYSGTPTGYVLGPGSTNLGSVSLTLTGFQEGSNPAVGMYDITTGQYSHYVHNGGFMMWYR